MNVDENNRNGLCCSCGICQSVCQTGAISYDRIDGMYVPKVDSTRCTNCGICYDVCPGFSQEYVPNLSHEDNAKDVFLTAKGKHISCFNAWSKDSRIRHNSASGGVTTSLIQYLLDKHIYDNAFCVNTYSYDHQLYTALYEADKYAEQLTESFCTCKSRYLPVSHAATVKFMLSNRDKKIIIVAVPCAVNGLLRVIEKFKLKRDNYLIIGLFCERVFQYNVNDLYNDLCKKTGTQIVKFHFKNKESGGWPGNMKFYYSDFTYRYKNKFYRMIAKNYFQPERCLYCIDKISALADISLGDNYTQRHSSSLGSNSVIVRTNRGLIAWKEASPVIEQYGIDIDSIAKAQELLGRMDNYYYSLIKQKQLKQENLISPKINSGVLSDVSYELLDDIHFANYYTRLSNIKIGKEYSLHKKQFIKMIRKKRWETIIFEKKEFALGKLSRIKRRIIK